LGGVPGTRYGIPAILRPSAPPPGMNPGAAGRRLTRLGASGGRCRFSGASAPAIESREWSGFAAQGLRDSGTQALGWPAAPALRSGAAYTGAVPSRRPRLRFAPAAAYGGSAGPPGSRRVGRADGAAPSAPPSHPFTPSPSHPVTRFRPSEAYHISWIATGCPPPIVREDAQSGQDGPTLSIL